MGEELANNLENTLNNFKRIINEITSRLLTLKDFQELAATLYELIGEVFKIKSGAMYTFKAGRFEMVSKFDDFDVDNVTSLEEANIVEWVLNNAKPIIYPEKHTYLLIPFSQGEEHIAFFVGVLNSDDASVITSEQEEILKVIMFQTSSIAKSVMLYEELNEQKNEVEYLKDYYSSILNNLNSSILILDDDMNTVFTNTVFKQNFVDYNDIDDSLKEKIKLMILDSSEDSFSFMEYEDKDKFLSLGIMKFTFSHNTNYILIIDDISNTKQLQKLKQLDKMKSDFLANVLHELRTPLGSFKAYVETILDSIDVLDKDTLLDFMKVLQGESDRLEAIVENIVGFALLSSKMENVDKEQVNLFDSINEVVEKYKNNFDDKKIDIKIDIDKNIKVSFDPKMLKQIINHIIDNAAKYADYDNKSDNYLKIYMDNDMLVFEDNGIGIADENKDKIFEEFFRVDESHTIPGTGIGLNIATRLAQINGAKLLLLDSKLGEGSKFGLIFSEIL